MSGNALYDALSVIVKDTHIAQFLGLHDPKALAQAEAAIKEVDDAALDGHKHVPINIDEPTREKLRFFLQYQAPRGMGYTAFIEWALQTADRAVAECENDGSGYCMVHGGNSGTWDDDAFECDMRGMD